LSCRKVQVISAVERHNLESKVVAFVSDNASTMKVAWDGLHELYPQLITIGCVAHSLNLFLKVCE
jgi:hypothetical protein